MVESSDDLVTVENLGSSVDSTISTAEPFSSLAKYPLPSLSSFDIGDTLSTVPADLDSCN